MALRKIIETEGKSIIQTPVGDIEVGTQRLSFFAYIKVTAIYGDKSQVNASVNFLGDSAQFTKNYQIPVSVEAGSENFIKQAYGYLKTLPEFADAVDC